MSLKFCNNNFISPIDLITMGDSEKRDDPDKIGKFSSGLKFAISLFLINGTECFITSGNYEYRFGTKELKIGEKTKEVIVIKQTDITSKQETEYVTGFAKNMALHWDYWMAFREIYSNTLDEGGVVLFPGDSYKRYDTTFEIEVDDNVQEIIDCWGNYFINEEPIIENSEVKLFNSPDNKLRIYKQGILIFEDLDQKSLYNYDYKHAGIDERRVLNDHWNLKYAIASCISKTEDLDFINNYLCQNKYPNGFWEEEFNHENDLGEKWVITANSLTKNEEPIVTTSSLFKAMSKDNRFKIGVRSIKVDSHYFSSTVTVKELPKEQTFLEKVKEILSKYDFEQNFEIKESEMSGSIKAIADIYNNCIFIASDFTEEDMWQYTKAYIRILTKGKNDDEIFKLYTEKIKNENSI